MKKILASLLALMLVIGMVPAMAEDAAPTYTYVMPMVATPLNWNPHAWEMSNEDTFRTLVELPLVDTTIAEDGVNFEWIYEGADAVVDITADFADKAKYGIPEDATEGYVYQVDLNQQAKWEDGTPINADSYVYSMQQCLNPEMKNYRANTYYAGNVALANAANYYNNDNVGKPLQAALGDLGFASAGEAIAAGYTDLAVDVGSFWGVALEDGTTVVSITDETQLRDEAVEEGQPEDYVSAKYLYETYLADGMPYADYAPQYVVANYVIDEVTPWENVGLVKTGDYQFLYIMERNCKMFDLLSSFTSGWLVNETLYEAGKEQREQLVATNYGTSIETYVSSGPYRIVSFEKDKQIVLEKNENWIGNFDGRHDGQYQATHVKIEVIPDHNSALLTFNQGGLDTIELQSNDMATYRMSDNLMKTDETYTFRWIFATSLESLKALEEQANDGSNKQVLSYLDFRKAMSLAIDRSSLCAQATAAYKPAYYLLNYLYYYDIANDTESIYRNTDVAKEAVLNLYGIEYGDGKTYATVDEAFDSVTGYDLEEARALFQSVYEQAIADGLYTDGQAINITCMATGNPELLPDDIAQQDMMTAFMAEATKGTGFEGKISFKFLAGAANRYADVAAGRYEMIRGAWGGAAFKPYEVINLYVDPDYLGGLSQLHESNGWDPTVKTMDVTYDFDGDGTPETVTDTFQNWGKAVNVGGKYYDDSDMQLSIIAALETGILEAYQCIPWAISVVAELYSQKIEWATLDYNIMYGYGGIRLLSFNYSDAEWTDYVASQGGQLNYE